MIRTHHDGEIREDGGRSLMLRHINRRMTRPSSVGYLLLLGERRGWSLHLLSMSFVPCRHRCGEAKREWPTCTELGQLRAVGDERADVAGQYAEALQALVEGCQGVAAVERTKCLYHLQGTGGRCTLGVPRRRGQALLCVLGSSVCCPSCNLPPSGLSSSQSHVCWAWLLSGSPRGKIFLVCVLQ
jgi:hypothetical protein